jgi:hypothetical protein
MAGKDREGAHAHEPAVGNRWWVDIGGGDKMRAKRPPGPVGSRLFRAGKGFEQERARERLTDNNLKLVVQAQPVPGQWAYIQLGEEAFPQRELERIKKAVRLPAYARGVIVDCGLLLRLLVTGTPSGERLLDLTLGEVPSFDCWIGDDWVREELFEDAESAIAAFRGFIKDYLSPESITRYESIVPRA